MTMVPKGEKDLRELSSPSQRFGQRVSENSTSELLLNRLVEKERLNLSNSLDSFAKAPSLTRAASIIVAARRRLVFGSGKSYAFANLFATDLAAGLSQVVLVDDTVVRRVDILAEIKRTDVLIAFSFRRYRTDTIQFAKIVVEAGGKFVLVTDDLSSPLAKLADESIIVSTASESYLDSPTAVVSAIHILSTLTTASAKGARRRLTRRDQLAHDLGLYWMGQ